MDALKKNSPPTMALRLWLFTTAFMVFVMVLIGAITRLTESGLSMVEWRPLMGALPPMNDAEWMRVFDLYKQSPEYQKVNTWMGLSDFKSIFFWEWFHRLWGRMIGLVYALPMVWFWVRGIIPKDKRLHYLGLLALGGAQGLMGWVMVKSGLIDRPSVSHFRLAAHLSLAFIVFALLVGTGLGVGKKKPEWSAYPSLINHLWGVIVCAAITIAWGAFVAGLDAGLIYNEFPKMGERWIPNEVTGASNVWYAFVYSPGAVQFVHRCMAIFTAVMVLVFYIRMVLSPPLPTTTKKQVFKSSYPSPPWGEARWGGSVHMLPIAIIIQISLGIATLYTNVSLHVAVTHQAGALILVLLLTMVYHRLRYASADAP